MGCASSHHLPPAVPEGPTLLRRTSRLKSSGKEEIVPTPTTAATTAATPVATPKAKNQKFSQCMRCCCDNGQPPLLFPSDLQGMPVHKYSKIQYKMYVLPVPVLMGLEKLTHHQELLKKGLLQEWTPDMEGRIIFVSHQWLGYEHPDPDGKHLAALQQLLKELMEGKIHKVETSWRGQLVSKNTCTVTAREWAAALPHMFIWMDYSGIPQVREETGDQDFEASPAAACNLSSSSDVDFGVMTKQSSTTSMNYTDLNRWVNLSASTDAATVVTRSSCSSAASSDHRFSKESSSILADLKRAIDSIPGYVERSSLMLVLVPPCEHSDTSQICNFSTWRSRGWCRVEFMAAHLSRKGINVMIDHGGSNPCFVFPFDALTLPAGRGNFSCCALNHSYNGVAIPCDKANLQPVIEGMVQRKVRHLKMSGQRERSLFYGAMQNRFLDGLPSSHELAQTRMQLASMQPHGPLAAAKIKERLAWNLDDDQAGLETGWSLLMCAALADDYETVRHLLKLGSPGINKGLKQPWPDLGCAPAGLTPLMAAMAFARFEIVEALLAAGANPHATDNDGRKIDAFSLACVWGRAENIEKWLEKFPGWNLERREGSVGATPLHAAVAYPAVSTPALKVLLAAGADPHARAHGGWGALNFVASKDDSDPEAVRLLLAAGVDVNRRTRPGSAKWKATLLACRSAYKLGMHDPLVDRFASVGGDTALHSAYIEGHSEIIQILKDAGADDELKNKMGQKPKDMMAS